ncbi:MAG: ATP-binding protein [Thermoleophilaceae bacterium]
MTPPEYPGEQLRAERVAQLLDDARQARDAGDWAGMRALATAARALDSGNSEAEALLAAATELRQISLLFCDMVDSTAIAETREPEDVSAIMHGYRDACARVVERFGGSIEGHRGDGMFVRFGYPEVHPDDARRAVLSGLAMVEAVREAGRRLMAEHGVDLQCRVAVHTDLVLIENGAVMGSAPNLAARLQTLAEPDRVVISDATHELVQGHFECDSLGLAELKGVSRPVEVFAVRGERVGRALEAESRLTPFIGRRGERARVETLWHGTRERAAGNSADTANALLVSGTAGVGKSRLILELVRELGMGCTECHCSSYHETTSLLPFTRLLERACGILPSDEVPARAAKLRRRLGDGPDLPFLAAALQIPASAISPPQEVDPAKLRELALFEAARLVHDHVGDGPGILLVDDIHWADPSSLDLITLLLSLPWPGLLVVLTARDDFEPPWPEAMVERLRLEPLSAGELREMAGSIPESSHLSTARCRELIDRSDGVPLFLEELIRTGAAIDQGRALHRSIEQADYAIPPALRDPLLARLAAPGVEPGLVQTAATIGREMDREFLRQVSGLPDELFAQRLDAMVDAGLIDRSGSRGIRFRHELIREVAYETQPRSARRDRHSQVADHLLREGEGAHFGDAGQAAFHLERARRHKEAIHAHVAEAQAAQQLGAHIEATTRLTHALMLTMHLSEGAERLQTELLVRQLRSFSAMMAGGYAAPESAEDHRRCVEICEELGLGPELIPSLIRSWSYYAFRGDLDAADRVTDAMERGFPSDRVDFPLAYVGRGLTDFFRGRFVEARGLMEAFIAHPWGHTTGTPPEETWQLPNDPLASVTVHLVPILWIRGEREAANEMAERALERAEGLRFPHGPFSLAYVHSLLAMTRRLAGDHAAAGRHGRIMVQIGERHGFALWRLAGLIQEGLTSLHRGDQNALDQAVANVSAWRHVLVADVWSPYWLTELAAGQRAIGRLGDAQKSLHEALVVAATTGSEFYSSETLRMQGELRVELGQPEGPADLQAALDLARAQEAPLFELRAAMALARASSGSPAARDALEKAIGRFSKDAQPQELDEARSLAAL